MPTITSNNGFTLRSLKISDYTSICETLEDFPVAAMTMSMVQAEMSVMMGMGKGFEPYNSSSSSAIALVLEKDSTFLGFRYTIFVDGVAEVRMEAIHPDERGKKYASALGFLHGYWYVNTLSVTSMWGEGANTTAATNYAIPWRAVHTGTETTRAAEKTPTVTLGKLSFTAAEFTSKLNSHSTYGSVTFTVSQVNCTT